MLVRQRSLQVARASGAAAAGPDALGLTLLASGHFVIDALVGAVPALIPLFAARFDLTDLAAALILAASLLVSSAIQPFFGLAADRRPAPSFLWGGVVVGAAGLAVAGLAGSYWLLLVCIVVSGLGIAAFHPEAARVANQIAGRRVATGLAWFMVGGNAGFAAGPLIAALFIPLLGARATLVFLVPAGLVAAWIFSRRARLGVPTLATPARRAGVGGPAHVPGVSLLLAVTSLRTWTQFSLLALVPLFLIETRGFGEQSAGLSAFYFSLGGAVGTIAGAAIADRAGGRRMLMWTMPLTSPLVAGFLLTSGALSLGLLSAAGLVLMASFSVTVAMGQEYLPHRLALAAGLMIGFGAIGSGPPGLALFGWIAESAGRETALWALTSLPLLGGLLAAGLPAPRTRGPEPAHA